MDTPFLVPKPEALARLILRNTRSLRSSQGQCSYNLPMLSLQQPNPCHLKRNPLLYINNYRYHIITTVYSRMQFKKERDLYIYICVQYIYIYICVCMHIHVTNHLIKRCYIPPIFSHFLKTSHIGEVLPNLQGLRAGSTFSCLAEFWPHQIYWIYWKWTTYT